MLEDLSVGRRVRCVTTRYGKELHLVEGVIIADKSYTAHYDFVVKYDKEIVIFGVKVSKLAAWKADLELVA